MVRAAPRGFWGAQLAMLEIRSLSKAFGGVKATDNVTLDFADGSLTAAGTLSRSNAVRKQSDSVSFCPSAVM